MLAACSTRQSQANSINQSPAAWDQLPRPGLWERQLYSERQQFKVAKDQTGCIKVEMQLQDMSKSRPFGDVFTIDSSLHRVQ